MRAYKDYVDLNLGRIPDERTDLWLRHRTYLVNCMRLVDSEFARIAEAMDRLDLWRDTVVILTGDHGEMNGAHRLTQRAAIAFDEAAVVNLTVCAPEGPQGARAAAAGLHLDLAPTLLAFAGLSEEEAGRRYPHLKGHSLRAVMEGPIATARAAAPRRRGTARSPAGTGSMRSTTTGRCRARSRR